jgi:hypothetical protein
VAVSKLSWSEKKQIQDEKTAQKKQKSKEENNKKQKNKQKNGKKKKKQAKTNKRATQLRGVPTTPPRATHMSSLDPDDCTPETFVLPGETLKEHALGTGSSKKEHPASRKLERGANAVGVDIIERMALIG